MRTEHDDYWRYPRLDTLEDGSRRWVTGHTRQYLDPPFAGSYVELCATDGSYSPSLNESDPPLLNLQLRTMRYEQYAHTKWMKTKDVKPPVQVVDPFGPKDEVGWYWTVVEYRLVDA